MKNKKKTDVKKTDKDRKTEAKTARLSELMPPAVTEKTTEKAAEKPRVRPVSSLTVDQALAKLLHIKNTAPSGGRTGLAWCGLHSGIEYLPVTNIQIERDPDGAIARIDSTGLELRDDGFEPLVERSRNETTFVRKHRDIVGEMRRLAEVLNAATKTTFAMRLTETWAFEARITVWSGERESCHYTGSSMYSPEHALDVLRKSLVKEAEQIEARTAGTRMIKDRLAAVKPVDPPLRPRLR